MMVLQHSSVRKFLYRHACYKLLNTKIGILSLSYAVIPSFLISVHFIDPNFILKFINFNILICLVFLVKLSNERSATVFY